MFGFPDGASGLFVTGTSMANLMAVLVARTAALGQMVRQRGVGEPARADGLHLDRRPWLHRQGDGIAGFGSDALRVIEVDRLHRIDVAALRRRIALDRAAASRPFWWSDGGNGGHRRRSTIFCALSAYVAKKISGSTSTAPMAPWHALARTGAAAERHRTGRTRWRSTSTNGARCPTTPASFWSATANNIARLSPRRRPICAARQGLAAGSPWPCDFGPDLRAVFARSRPGSRSRSTARKSWAPSIARTCALAGYLEARILAEPRLELLAPVQLNIVCFRYRAADADG